MRITNINNWIEDRTHEGADIVLPQGVYYLEKPVTALGDAPWVSLGGAGMMQTQLIVPAGAGFTAIDARGHDEGRLYGMRIIEDRGSKQSTLVQTGGTSFAMHDVWLGNAGRGFDSDGAGMRLQNVVIEACTTGMLLHGRARNSVLDTIQLNNCAYGLHISDRGDGVCSNIMVDKPILTRNGVAIWVGQQTRGATVRDPVGELNEVIATIDGSGTLFAGGAFRSNQVGIEVTHVARDTTVRDNRFWLTSAAKMVIDDGLRTVAENNKRIS